MKGLKNAFKALRIIAGLDKWLLPLMAVNVACKNVAPYIDTVLGAWILDGLLNGLGLRRMLPVILGALGLRLLLRACAELAEQVQWERDGLVHDLYLTKRGEKNLAMDYAELTSPAVNALRDRINQDDMYGWGISSVADYFQKLLGSLASIAAALAIVVPLIRMGGAAAAYLAVTAAAITASAAVNGYFSKKTQELIDSYEHSRSHSSYYLWGNAVDYKIGKDIRVFGAQPLIERAINADEGERAGRRRYLRCCDKRGLFNGTFGGALQGTSYIYVVVSAAKGLLSAGEVMKLAEALYFFWGSLQELLTAVAQLLQAANRLSDTLDFLALPEAVGGRPAPEPADGAEIEFKNVSFAYPSGKRALDNVSCKISRGERLAIVGPNGSGKTTFIKLLCRLYRPDSGEILLNGVNVWEYDFGSYIRLLSVVFQDFGLFPLTLGENVAASESRDDGRAAKALETAGFGERLASLPNGLDTPLYKSYDDSGVDVSGGEAQKIALARALYKDAPFMVLDEPTAALDPVAEYEIYSRFNGFVQGKGAIYISHRLSSCVFCDRILVFDGGKIVQSGPHAALLAEDGLYARLWNAQAQYYK